MKEYFKNLIGFLVKNEQKIVLVVGIILIGLVSFTFGMMKGKGISQEPTIISLAENPPVVINSNESNSLEEKNMIGESLSTCIYVGSKKGVKYYPPDCSYAKNINPDNLRCFSSDEDAIKKGYTKSTSCN